MCDFELIKKHPWFSRINWKDLGDKKITPPYKPIVKSSDDTRNFDEVFTKQPIAESLETNALSPSPNQFSGFTYLGSAPISMTDIPS